MSHRRSQRREAGQASGSLVLLLVILCVGGAFNYHRNLQRERDSERIRPYKAYAVADLEALREAYRAELESSRRSFQSAQRARAGTARDAGSVGRNIASSIVRPPRVARFATRHRRWPSARARSPSWIARSGSAATSVRA